MKQISQKKHSVKERQLELHVMKKSETQRLRTLIQQWMMAFYVLQDSVQTQDQQY